MEIFLFEKYSKVNKDIFDKNGKNYGGKKDIL